MVSERYPSTYFRPCKLKNVNDLYSEFAYLIRIRFYNIESKFYNNIISKSKCRELIDGRYDNGRVIGAKELEIVLTDIDLKLILQCYDFKKYEILESYYSVYNYLPKQYIEFILEKYKKKTELKNVEDKKIEYALEKANFNALYRLLNDSYK